MSKGFFYKAFWQHASIKDRIMEVIDANYDYNDGYFTDLIVRFWQPHRMKASDPLPPAQKFRIYKQQHRFWSKVDIDYIPGQSHITTLKPGEHNAPSRKEVEQREKLPTSKLPIHWGT